MSSFEKHLWIGARLHLVAIVPIGFASFTVASVPASLLAWWMAATPATLFGSIAPDADHHAAHAYRAVYRWGPVWVGGTVAGVLTAVVIDHSHLWPVPELRFVAGFGAGTGCILLAGGVGYEVKRVIPKLRPPHRGVLHRVSVGALVGAGVGAYVFAVALGIGIDQPGLVGGTWMTGYVLGFVSHLWEDDALVGDG